jgi:hypothetical protein
LYFVQSTEELHGVCNKAAMWVYAEVWVQTEIALAWVYSTGDITG